MKSTTGDRDGVAPIGEHPRFATAAKLLATLTSEQRALYKSISAIRDAAYLRSQAEAGLSGSDALEQAQRLLAGEHIDHRDAAAKIREAEQRLAIIDPAIREQAQRLATLRSALSAETGLRVQPRHRKALADLFAAARALAAAGQVELRIRGELIAAGFEVSDHTSAPRFAIHLVMGDEGWCDSPLSVFKRWLEELKIL